MQTVTRYQAPDGTLHETAVACERHEAEYKLPVPPGPKWGIWNHRKGHWVYGCCSPVVCDTPEEVKAMMEEFDDDPLECVVAQYSARPPEPPIAVNISDFLGPLDFDWTDADAKAAKAAVDFAARPPQPREEGEHDNAAT